MPYIAEYTNLNVKEVRQLKYKRQYKNDVPTWDDSMVLLTNLVRERISNNVSILDFGCGRGNFVIDELRTYFSRVIGFDLLQESTTGNVSCDEIVFGKDECLPFSDASFDGVISLWVFEHVKDPEVVMREIYRVLKPGGFFAFVTPNRRSLLIRLRKMLSDGIARRLLKWLYGREDEDVFQVHYKANTQKDILRLCEKTSFIAEYICENADPSYTSFGSLSYTLSKLFTGWFPSLANPHCVVILRKTMKEYV